MVYGRYNELVFMDVNGGYKLTNITGGHQPVGEEAISMTRSWRKFTVKLGIDWGYNRMMCSDIVTVIYRGWRDGYLAIKWG